MLVSWPIESGGETLPLGLPPVSVPPNNLQSAEKIAIGKALFHDRRLSADGKVSCATCHKPDHAFTDGLPVAVGAYGRKGTRNTPSLLNVAYLTSLFWDGRRTQLEEQAKDPFVNQREHGHADHNTVVRIVQGDDRYVEAFRRIFGVQTADIDMRHIGDAIASFERSLLSGNSPFDRYFYGSNKQAMSPQAVHGLEVFQGRARCVTCHTIGAREALFTDNQFHRIGVGFDRIVPRLGALAKKITDTPAAELDALVVGDPEISALGRYVVTGRVADVAKFRTPSLRNVALTAPYMHDGSVATLQEAIEQEIYYRSAESGRPLVLTSEEKAALIAFLSALTTQAHPNSSTNRN